jgi:hypothetical protein
LLVALATKITGGVSYERNDVIPEHIAPDGSLQAAWETKRTVELPDEHEEAVRVRGKCRSLITGVCAHSSFGLLCPEDRIDDLGAAIREAQGMAAAFNNIGRVTRISVFVIAGRIAADDLQAVRAINSEVTDLLARVETGLEKLDVEMIRDAAKRATSVGRMLSPAAQERVKDALAVARSAARRIVKAAEQGAVEIDHAAIRAIRDSRVAFLDYEAAAPIATPEAQGRALDLEMPDDAPRDPTNPFAPLETSIPEYGDSREIAAPAPVARNLELPEEV